MSTEKVFHSQSGNILKGEYVQRTGYQVSNSMNQRYVQSIVLIFTVAAGIYTTSLANKSADWFVDKYLSEPWIDPLTEVIAQRNCDPLVFVLDNYGEVDAGKERLGTVDPELGKFEEPPTLTSKLTKKIANLNVQT